MANKPDFFNGWTEPESAANTEFRPVYPHNNVTQTKSGHSFEMDDTSSRERIRLQHRSGTFTEMHPNGDEVHKIYGDGYTIIFGDHNISIGVEDGNKAKKLNITVYGDVNMYVQGDLIEQVDGNVEQYIKGNYTQVVDGISSITSQGDLNISCGGFLGGGLNLNVSDALNINGDLSVSGEIVAEKIASYTRVDALTGMSAGPLGFVTEFGGVSVGIPVAVPETINCLGPINSLSMITAPLGNFIITDSFLAFDIVNLLLHNIHIHPTPKGPTGIPIPIEIV
jgi:hypothetical protein